MRNRPSFLKFLRDIQKNSRGVLTQRKKSCILHFNRLLTYCQAREGVIHYESYRRQMPVGSACDARHDCDIPWHFDKRGRSVLFSRCGRFRNWDWECQPYAYHPQSDLRRQRNGGSAFVNGIAIGLLLAMMASVTLLIRRMYRRDEHGVLSKQY